MVRAVFDARAVSQAALAQVIKVEVPLHALRPVDAEHLEGIEFEKGLVAEDIVVAKMDVVDVISWFLEVRRDCRPVEDGDAADVQVVVRATRESLVGDGWSTGNWIDRRLLEVF